MIPIDGNFILSVAPRFSGARAKSQARIVGVISDQLAPTLEQYDIKTKLRIAHFMGQVTHECAGFRTTEEFAGAAYEGRKDLGNTEEGDGKRFKGRGLIQLTGRYNYRKMATLLDLPLEDHPEIAAEPVNALKIACEYWRDRDINTPADQDNLVKATRLVNGGLNGLEDRGNYLRKAKTALAGIEAIRVSLNEGGATTVLRRGSFGDAVTKLQERLTARGFEIAIDGDFGPATELAVTRFQKDNGLTADGIVGRQTWDALEG